MYEIETTLTTDDTSTSGSVRLSGRRKVTCSRFHMRFHSVLSSSALHVNNFRSAPVDLHVDLAANIARSNLHAL